MSPTASQPSTSSTTHRPRQFGKSRTQLSTGLPPKCLLSSLHLLAC